MRIAVTGGAGYIGSHTVVALLEAGHDVLILDNFLNSEDDVPDRITALTSRDVGVHVCDVTRPDSYSGQLAGFQPDAVIHFAGLKAMGEAAVDPLEYYRVNVGGSVSLLKEMERIGCTRIVFSSSATVYGAPETLPIPETHPLAPTNAYGHSKRMVEQILEHWGQANGAVSAVNLRYFNPVGAHPSARIGETPTGTPQNLMPYVAQVAAGWRKELSVFGDDYETPDGTGVRDYIHVLDLASAHLAALDLTYTSTGVRAINVGTGRGYSVLEMIRTFEEVSGQAVPYNVVARRSGDVAQSVADPTMARDVIGWSATRGLEEMCRDAWAWQRTRNR